MFIRNQQEDKNIQASSVISFSQRTIRNEISCIGIGLHSGLRTKLTLKPADIDTGIVFKRTDIKGNSAVIPASYDNVVDTRLCTCLGDKEGNRVSTVEHIMSALHGLGITNIEIEVNAEEIPLLDGSANNFVFLIKSAGIVEQQAPLKAIKVKKEITVKDGDAFISLSPCENGLNIDFNLDYTNCSFIGHQQESFTLNESAYVEDIASARTFGLAKEVEQIKKLGLAKGGSLENVVVVTDEDVLNPEGLRFDNEFVRHKILDMVGDFYLSGYTLTANVKASKSGHNMNNMIIRALLADPDAWEIELLSDVIPTNISEKEWKEQAIA